MKHASRVQSAALVFFLMLAPLLPGCASDPDGKDSPRLAAEEQIRFVIIAYERTDAPGVGETPPRVLFVSGGQGTDYRELGEKFFAQIPSGPVRVEPYSACDFQPGGATDKRTGARGVLLQLGDVHWENDDQATVYATTWVAKGLGAVNVYHMIKSDGKWFVKERQSMGSA